MGNPLNPAESAGMKGPLTTTLSWPVWPGPASPSTVTTSPSGPPSATTPTWTAVSTFCGPVPYRIASPGLGTAAGDKSRPRFAPQLEMLPTNGYLGIPTPAVSQVQVANRAHHCSQGP